MFTTNTVIIVVCAALALRMSTFTTPCAMNFESQKSREEVELCINMEHFKARPAEMCLIPEQV